MNKVLLLYGLNCTADIWQPMLNELKNIEPEIIEYPHEVTLAAESVMDITKWVYDKVKENHYDVVIAHSMGGVIALQLAEMGMMFKHMILIETNLRPAEPFYRNLMTEEHMKTLGEQVMAMLKQEGAYASKKLVASLQEVFDYTPLIHQLNQKVDILYGDRNVKDYPNKITDLCLDEKTVDMMNFYFVEDSCHLPMIENPKGIAECIQTLIQK